LHVPENADQLLATLRRYTGTRKQCPLLHGIKSSGLDSHAV
jgi:hypothetical protein